MRFFLLRLLRVAVLSGLGVTLFLWGCQERLIYFPREYAGGEVADFAARGGVVLEYATSQGGQRAFFVPPVSGGGRIWVWYGGNAALALEYAGEVGGWDAEAGWLLVEFPGYGGLPGRPGPETVLENGLGAVAALALHLGMPRESLVARLGAGGQSLGAAAALMVADELGLRRVVLVSPFTTLTEMGRLTVGWPWCLLNRHGYDNRGPLLGVGGRGGRTWIVHGVDDEVVPVGMGRELAGLDPGRVRLIEVAGAGHNDLLEVAPEVLARVFGRVWGP